MKTPALLSGRLECGSCRSWWFSTWHTQAPVVFCHHCGGACMPVGVQQARFVGERSVDAEMFRIELAAWRRCES